MTNKKITVGVLGAGISGLSIAYSLQKKGIPVTVYERRKEVGGAIRTQIFDGWMVEEGPNTLMIKSTALWNLLDELELTGKIHKANSSARKRYIVKNGTPIQIPTSPIQFITSSLLSTKAKFRLLKEPFIPPSTHHDEAVSDFIERRLGREPLEYGVNPFVSGVYAGEPDELSVKHTFNLLWQMEQQHGSLLKGVLKRDKESPKSKRELISFNGGNQVLPEQLAVNLERPVKTSAQIISITKEKDIWIIKGDKFEARHSALVSTIPPYKLTDILQLPNSQNELKEIAAIPYAPLSVLAFGYKSEDIRHPLDGFGLLIPEVEDFKTLGVLFSSTLFPGRAPQGHDLLTCFIGGARRPDLAGASTEELTSTVQSELKTLLEIKGEPVFTHHKYWEKAIPQYTIGYDRFLNSMKEIETRNPGFFFQGNYRQGVSVPDCISSGFETSQKIDLFLKGLETMLNTP